MRIKTLIAGLILCLTSLYILPLSLAEEAIGTPREEMENFNNAFEPVPANPLPGDLPYLLWLIAQDPVNPQASVAETPLSPLEKSAAKFAALIQKDGVYFAETTSVSGMSMKAEYWMKGNKIKKNDLMLGEVTVFDGEWLYQYNVKGKAGVKLAPDAPEASDALSMLRNDRLSLAAGSPYRQQEDEKVKGFDCQVFYMDFGMNEMKGNWLYVDKATGALIKNQYGEEKGGMSITVTKLETGTFGDEAFEIPTKIKITGP